MESTPKPSIIMKFWYGCWAVLFPLTLLIVGIENIQHFASDAAKANRYRVPVTLTYEEFVKRHPQEGWFRITGGVIDLASATALKVSLAGDPKTFGTTASIKAPLRSLKDTDVSPSYVAISSMNRGLCDAWSHLHDVQDGIAKDGPQGDGSNASTAEAEDARAAARISKYAVDHPEKVFVARDIQGIIKPESLNDIPDNPIPKPQGMADDYVVLQDGTTGADYKEHTLTTGIVLITLVTL